MAEIESLKEKGEAKTHELENEVTILRKEVKALKTLLNAKEKKHEIKKVQNKRFLHFYRTAKNVIAIC